MAKPSCYNRPAYKDSIFVQDGWKKAKAGKAIIRLPLMKLIPDPMSKNCQQWGPMGEAKLKNWDCQGCRWKPEPELQLAPQ